MPYMDIGDVRTMEIRSRRRWNRTGVEVQPGQEYLLTGYGRWRDLFDPSDPGGHDGSTWIYRVADSRRRAPHLPWFSLVGALDRDTSTFFAIGLESTWSAPRAGEITCFANDVSFMYWNNSGSVSLSIERTR